MRARLARPRPGSGRRPRDVHDPRAAARSAAMTVRHADGSRRSTRHVLAAHRRAARAARAVRAGAQGGLHEHAVAAGRAGAASTRTRSRAPRMPEVSPALTVHDMSLWRPRAPARRPTRGPSASGSCTRTAGCASRSCATRRAGCGRAGSRSCCCASRGSSTRSATRPGSRACPSGRPSWSRTSGASSPRSARATARTCTGRSSTTSSRAAAARPRRPRRAARRDARAAARARRRPSAGRTAPGAGEPQPAGDRAAGRLRRARPPRCCARATRADFAAYGYAPPAGADPARPRPPGRRRRAGAARCCAPRSTQHARLGQLHRSPQRRGERAQAAEERLEAASGAPGRPRARPGAAQPRRGRLRRPLGVGGRRRSQPGFTGVLRVKRRGALAALDARRRCCARSRRVVLVDNGSTDGSAGGRAPRSRRTSARRTGSRCTDYPFAIARCGGRAPRHARRLGPQPRLLLQLGVRPRPHRLRAQVGRRHGAHRRRRRRAARPRLAARGRRGGRQDPAPPALRRRRPRTRYLDTGLRNCEPWALAEPARLQLRQGARTGSCRCGARDARGVTLPDWSCVELKHLDADEFAHWSRPTSTRPPARGASAASGRSFTALAAGAHAAGGRASRSTRPAGAHVIDHVRSAWLPARARSALTGGEPRGAAGASGATSRRISGPRPGPRAERERRLAALGPAIGQRSAGSRTGGRRARAPTARAIPGRRPRRPRATAGASRRSASGDAGAERRSRRRLAA